MRIQFAEPLIERMSEAREYIMNIFHCCIYKTASQLKARISDQGSDLREAKRNLRVLENRVKQMEDSEFWKLRNLWINLKGFNLRGCLRSRS